MTVGFFDSGIGGISVLEKAAVQLEYNDFLFYADLAHVPYGTKSKKEIINYVDHAVQFLHNKGADVIVLACNTATSAAAEYLRDKYSFPILGMEPAVKVASKALSVDYNKIIVTATELTLKLEKLESLINELGLKDNVEKISLQCLVEYAEDGVFDSNEVKNYLKERLNFCGVEKTAALVLGCTHFTFFKSLIKDVMFEITKRNIPIIDGNKGTVNYLSTIVEKDSQMIKPLNERIRFFESDYEVSFEKYNDLLNRAHFENAGGC